MLRDRPGPGEVPVVEGQPRCRGVPVRPVEPRAGLRGEPAALAVAEVGLGRLQRPPVGRHLQAAGLDHHEVLVDVLCAGLEQELLDDHLGHGVLALAEVVVPDAALGIGDVQRRPEAVGEGAPDG